MKILDHTKDGRFKQHNPQKEVIASKISCEYGSIFYKDIYSCILYSEVPAPFVKKTSHTNMSNTGIHFKLTKKSAVDVLKRELSYMCAL